MNNKIFYYKNLVELLEQKIEFLNSSLSLLNEVSSTYSDPSEIIKNNSQLANMVLGNTVSSIGEPSSLTNTSSRSPMTQQGGWVSRDFNGDGIVDGADLGLMLGAWGTSNPDRDLNGDGIVDGADLGLMLGSWGGNGSENPSWGNPGGGNPGGGNPGGGNPVSSTAVPQISPYEDVLRGTVKFNKQFRDRQQLRRKQY